MLCTMYALVSISNQISILSIWYEIEKPVGTSVVAGLAVATVIGTDVTGTDVTSVVSPHTGLVTEGAGGGQVFKPVSWD